MTQAESGGCLPRVGALPKRRSRLIGPLCPLLELGSRFPPAWGFRLRLELTPAPAVSCRPGASQPVIITESALYVSPFIPVRGSVSLENADAYRRVSFLFKIFNDYCFYMCNDTHYKTIQ